MTSLINTGINQFNITRRIARRLEGQRQTTWRATYGCWRDTSQASQMVLYAPASQLTISNTFSSVNAVTRISRRKGAQRTGAIVHPLVAVIHQIIELLPTER